MKSGIELITEERKHQIEKWGKDHDVVHHDDSLAIHASVLIDSMPRLDSWGLLTKHPDRIEQLKIAGALIAAEIDRRQMPCNRVDVELFQDGDQWCVLHGENLQEGIAGFGDTPDDALIAFNKAWLEEGRESV
jgi:hypothetical protein